MIDGDAVREIRDLAREGQEAQPRVIELGDETYATTELHRIREKEDEPDTLTVHSLGALVNYLEANRDELDLDQLMVHVAGPTRVDVLSRLEGDFRQRFCYLRAAVTADAFPFGSWMGHETFVIAMQTQFTEEGDKGDVLKVIGTLKDEAVRTQADDGVTQTVTAKAGIVRAEDVEVPNPVELSPYRTFRELEQPSSRFVLRVRKGNHGPEVSLHEADGGAWKLTAVKRVKDWLVENLAESVTLIA